MRALRRLLVPALLASGAALIASAVYIPAKAALAQVLLERAWDRARSGDANAKPWPWADVSPVAVLEVPRLDERSIVLEGASGEAMAFGPGHMSNTPPIGARGTAPPTATPSSAICAMSRKANASSSRPRTAAVGFASSRPGSCAPMRRGSIPMIAALQGPAWRLSPAIHSTVCFAAPGAMSCSRIARYRRLRQTKGKVRADYSTEAARKSTACTSLSWTGRPATSVSIRARSSRNVRCS